MGPGKRTLTEKLPAGQQQRQQGQLPFRADMEQAFGQEFSAVKVATGQSSAMGKLGATAAARGEAIAFADADPDRRTVAHELTHVVQQRQSAISGDAQRKPIAGVESAPELEAERVADRVAGGQDAGEITAKPAGQIHRHAPDAHRAATEGALIDTFSAQEIAQIYLANWERDFSQGSPVIASAATAWVDVKNEAKANNGDPGAAGAHFKAAIWELVKAPITEALATSLGGYQTWEHMDRPDEGVAKKADARWEGKTNGLSGYLLDTKAYIKDQLVAALDMYRTSFGLDEMAPVDNWGGAEKPDGYTAPGHKDVRLPKGWDDTGVSGRSAIQTEVRREVVAKGGKRSGADHEFDAWKIVGEHLGRAMHSFEDFWAHSNWVELALGLKAVPAGMKPGSRLKNSDLTTGTFAEASKVHALGHKLVAMATAFERDQALLQKVYGRTGPSTKLESAGAQLPPGANYDSHERSDHQMAYESLESRSLTLKGELLDVGAGTSNVEQMVRNRGYKMDDFLCNPTWLAALRAKGEHMIEEGDKAAGENDHGKLAKDQPEGGKGFDLSLQLSTKADQIVFAPLRAVMDERDAKKALALTKTQLSLVDTLLQAPSPSHPLWGIVAAASSGGQTPHGGGGSKP